MPYLSGITIYPVKSLDGLGLSEATVLRSGALMHDRRWRLVDDEGAVVNAKKNARFHAIRASFHIEGSGSGSNEGSNVVTLSVDESVPGDLSSLGEETFPLVPGRDGPCGWLSEALATDVFLQERFDGGFPDDQDAYGPTVISTETLTEVAGWFRWPVEEARRRFRMNLELISSARDSQNSADYEYSLQGPFWEESLACPLSAGAKNRIMDDSIINDFQPELSPGEPSRFLIGDILFRASGVCRRCIVPSRDSVTGTVTHVFRDVFEAFRMVRTRGDVETGQWSDAFRLGINTTSVRGESGSIRVGQLVSVRN